MTPPEQNPDRPRPALQPPQFTLLTLMGVVAALGALFAAMSATGPLGGFALLLLVLGIVAHIAGNSLGTRLRAFGNVPADDQAAGKRATPKDARDASAPASNLSQHSRISRTMIVFTASGAAILGVSGGTLLIWLTWQQLNVATAVVAVISPTVLGGWLGFAVSSFTQTLGGAVREANQSHRP